MPTKKLVEMDFSALEDRVLGHLKTFVHGGPVRDGSPTGRLTVALPEMQEIPRADLEKIALGWPVRGPGAFVNRVQAKNRLAELDAKESPNGK